MSAFKKLQDAATNFEEQIKTLSSELFVAKPIETAEDVIAKKLKDVQLFSAKCKLLRNKIDAADPQIIERIKSGADILTDYEETVQKQVLENMIVKSLTQTTAVQKLVTTPYRKLDPDQITKKDKIIQLLNTLRTKESELRQLDSVLQTKEDECRFLTATWDKQLGDLREKRESVNAEVNLEESGPGYEKLKTLVNKMEMIRWLLGCLIMTRKTKYDWLTDPHKRISVLRLTREINTVSTFIEDYD